MDYYRLRDWRNQQHESDHAAKIPRLFLDQPHQEAAASESSSALPLFVPDHEHHHHHHQQQLGNRSIISNLSAFPDSTNTSRASRMIGSFSLAQWQELELQALIFKYMLAGATVPSELLQPIIKKSLFNNPPSPFFLHQQYQHYQPSMLQSGYWGRTSVDPEPGRCRRTDGKKWRCSKDVVSGQKYCERHMHRGRNRSRKPVEISTRPIITNNPSSSVTIASVGNSNGLIKSANNTIAPVAALPLTAMGNTNKNGGNAFVISCDPSNSSPSMDLLHLNQRYCESERRSNDNSVLGDDGRTDGQVLRHFFDDWPKKSQHQPTNGVGNSADGRTSSTCLSISIENGEEHHNHPKPSSDFSLKLATGVEDESGKENCRDERSQVMNWGGMSNSMGGGPLAEALRSSSNSSSPTSVLHPPPQISVSESSSIITK